MSKRYFKLVLALALAVSTPAWATNGTNLIGVGPVSRGMGGTGVAAPQDAISAIFANPAAMCFGSFCPGSEATFGGTIFSPKVNSSVKGLYPAALSGSADSQMNPFIVPALGISTPITPKIRFGFGAYGVSGLGVDYRGAAPAYGDIFTQLQVMKFAPSLAFQVNNQFSIGGNLPVVYQGLDLGEGTSHDYALGLQLGLVYKVGMFSFGASYTAPQSVTHEKVTTFGTAAGANPNYASKTWFDLKLESPPIYAGGIAWTPTDPWLLAFDVKYLPWGDAAGYQDFDWKNQTVFSLGAQYRVTNAIALRAGYNYGKNPVNTHNGYNPAENVNIQGAAVPRAMYEQFRILGFPAVVEQHLTLGLGWQLAENFILDFSLMHAFKNSISQTDLSGNFSQESSMEQTSTSFGMTWRF